MSDLWAFRRRNSLTVPSDEDFWRYLDVLPPAPRHRGRSQFRLQNTTSPPSLSSRDCSCCSTTSSTASRVLHTMKRSLSYNGAQKKRSSSLADSGMHSTPEESLPPSPSSYNVHEMRNVSPSIEQIAMGLHTSRTPHLPYSQYRPRGTGTAPSGFSPNSSVADAPISRRVRPSLQHHRRESAPPIIRPPPTRSSLKNSRPMRSDSINTHSSIPGPLTPSASDASLSSLTSAAPSTPRSNRSNTSTAHSIFSSTRFHLSVSRLFSGRKSSAPTSPTIRSSDDDSSSSVLTPRKAVRFSVGDRDVPDA